MAATRREMSVESKAFRRLRRRQARTLLFALAVILSVHAPSPSRHAIATHAACRTFSQGIWDIPVESGEPCSTIFSSCGPRPLRYLRPAQ